MSLYSVDVTIDELCWSPNLTTVLKSPPVPSGKQSMRTICEQSSPSLCLFVTQFPHAHTHKHHTHPHTHQAQLAHRVTDYKTIKCLTSSLSKNHKITKSCPGCGSLLPLACALSNKLLFCFCLKVSLLQTFFYLYTSLILRPPHSYSDPLLWMRVLSDLCYNSDSGDQPQGHHCLAIQNPLSGPICLFPTPSLDIPEPPLSLSTNFSGFILKSEIMWLVGVAQIDFFPWLTSHKVPLLDFLCVFVNVIVVMFLHAKVT